MNHSLPLPFRLNFSSLTAEAVGNYRELRVSPGSGGVGHDEGCLALKWDGPKGLVGMGRRRWRVVTSPSGTFSSVAHLEVVYPMLRRGLLSQTLWIYVFLCHSLAIDLGQVSCSGPQFHCL